MCRLNNLILIGFKSAGKTTLGRKAAEKYNKPFIDTDELLGEPAAAVHERLGEKGFRALEKTLLYTLKDLTGRVIATGGGVPLDPENQKLLRELGTIVHVNTPKEIIRERIKNGPMPTFLKGFDFDDVYDFRLRIYESVAHYSISGEDELWEAIIF